MEDTDSTSDARRRKREQRILKNSSARLAKISYNWSSEQSNSEHTDISVMGTPAGESNSVGRSGDNVPSQDSTTNTVTSCNTSRDHVFNLPPSPCCGTPCCELTNPPPPHPKAKAHFVLE